MKIVKFLGGLGNQMFQYAFYLSLKNNFKHVKADIIGFENYELHNGMELEEVFNIQLDRASEFYIKLYDPNYRKWIFRKLRRVLGLKDAYFEELKPFVFDESIYLDTNDRLYWGYWQNEKYFLNIEDKIRSSFKFQKPLTGQNEAIVKLIAASESISIHVRRGDYVGHSLLGGICERDYYENAIALIKESVLNPVFFVFSNDIAWCKDNLNVGNAKYIAWNQAKESYKDMQLMSLCKHNIIANSSFSWWAAWLNINKGKRVIAPAKWVNEPGYDDSDVCPKNWIKI